jgi:hypothetical protein
MVWIGSLQLASVEVHHRSTVFSDLTAETLAHHENRV